MVFLKGCPLRCPWCSNPESQSAFPETAFSPSLCLGPRACGRCAAACPLGLVREEGGGLLWDRGRCAACGACASACPTGARSVFGRELTARQVMERVLEDSVFHQRSGGGVTLSGGEPLFQGGFALELLREAARWGVASAVETSGAADPAVLEEAGAMAGSVIYDLKHWDPGRLAEAGIREGGGGAPPGPAGNLRRLRRRLPSLPIQVRIPVVPGFNDSLGDLLRIAALVPPGLPPPELLPYHRMGEGKYALLGRVPPFRAEPPDPASFGALRDSFLRALAR